jgi:hypothetical protein
LTTAALMLAGAVAALTLVHPEAGTIELARS